MRFKATALGLLLIPFLAGVAQAQPGIQSVWQHALDDHIAALKQRFPGRISAYVSDLEFGVQYRYRADVPSYLASGVKVPFMVEVFRQADQGALSLDERLPYTEADIRDGSPVLNRKRLGSTYRISELLAFMIQSSDNAASDMLYNRVGGSNINQGLKDLGLPGFSKLVSLLDVRVGVFRALDVRADDLSNLDIRKVRWSWGWQRHLRVLNSVLGKPPGFYRPQDLFAAYERFYATGVNSARVDAIGLMLERMVQGALVSKDASRQMLALMYGSRTSRRRLLGRLPRGVRVAHKTGSQYERICDYGVIDLPAGRPLVLAICIEGGADRNAAEQTLASLSRKAYDLAVRTPSLR